MNAKAAAVSYLLNLVAVVIYPAVLFRLLSSSQIASMGMNLAYVVMLSIFGMVLMPYFEVASFTSGEHGYWKEVSALIHRHISLPFIGGYALSFLAIYPAGLIFASPYGLYNSLLAIFDPILAGYALFVFVASVITILSNRKPKQVSPVQATQNPAASA